MKQCLKCQKIQEISSFYERKDSKDRLNNICKECLKIKGALYYSKKKTSRAQYYLNNREYILREKKASYNKGFKQIYYQNNKEHILARTKNYYYKNLEQIQLRHRIYSKNNPESPAQYNLRNAKRRALKLNQTPSDADMSEISEFYKESERLTKKTGVAHHVDHIIPLSKGGLHHQDNLQVLTAEENLKKGSKIT